MILNKVIVLALALAVTPGKSDDEGVSKSSQHRERQFGGFVSQRRSSLTQQPPESQQYDPSYYGYPYQGQEGSDQAQSYQSQQHPQQQYDTSSYGYQSQEQQHPAQEQYDASNYQYPARPQSPSQDYQQEQLAQQPHADQVQDQQRDGTDYQYPYPKQAETAGQEQSLESFEYGDDYPSQGEGYEYGEFPEGNETVFSDIIWKVEYSVFRLWDGSDAPEPKGPVSVPDGCTPRDDITLTVEDMDDALEVAFEAPYHGDPPPPPRGTGDLSNYEEIEVFFLSSQDKKYLQLQLSPHGNYFSQIMDGTKKVVRDCLPLQYHAQIDQRCKTWSGKAQVPVGYFPPGVDKFNAFAAFGKGEARKTLALYPISQQTPDFHDFESYGEFEKFESITNIKQLPELWSNSISSPSVARVCPAY